MQRGSLPVPAALWPSVPKIIEEKLLGSAYSLIFWVQNIGLFFVPMLIGGVLASVNEDNAKVIAAQDKIEAITIIKDDVKKVSGTWDVAQIEAISAKADSILTEAKVDEASKASIMAMIADSKNGDNLYIQLSEEADEVLVPYNYTIPLVIFAGFGVAALLVALYLKRYDKKKGLGLELPNIKA